VKLLVLLCSACDEDGLVHPEYLRCAPSHEQLARRLGVHRDTIRRAMRDLRDRKFLAVKRAYRKDGGYAANTYTILRGAPAEGALGADDQVEGASGRQVEAGPDDQVEAGPGDQVEAGPDDQVEAGPGDQVEAGPDDQVEAGPGPDLEALARERATRGDPLLEIALQGAIEAMERLDGHALTPAERDVLRDYAAALDELQAAAASQRRAAAAGAELRAAAAELGIAPRHPSPGVGRAAGIPRRMPDEQRAAIEAWIATRSEADPAILAPLARGGRGEPLAELLAHLRGHREALGRIRERHVRAAATAYARIYLAYWLYREIK